MTIAAGYEVLPELPDRLPPRVAPKRFYACLEADGQSGMFYKQGDELRIHLRHDAVEALRLVVDTRTQGGAPWVRVYASDYTPGVPIRVFYDGPAAGLMTGALPGEDALRAEGAVAERAHLQVEALALAEKWEAAEGEDVPTTKADLAWKAEGLRDFAATLGPETPAASTYSARVFETLREYLRGSATVSRAEFECDPYRPCSCGVPADHPAAADASRRGPHAPACAYRQAWLPPTIQAALDEVRAEHGYPLSTASDLAQILNPKSDRYVKIDRATGRMEHKEDAGSWEGVPVVDGTHPAATRPLGEGAIPTGLNLTISKDPDVRHAPFTWKLTGPAEAMARYATVGSSFRLGDAITKMPAEYRDPLALTWGDWSATVEQWRLVSAADAAGRTLIAASGTLLPPRTGTGVEPAKIEGLVMQSDGPLGEQVCKVLWNREGGLTRAAVSTSNGEVTYLIHVPGDEAPYERQVWRRKSEEWGDWEATGPAEPCSLEEARALVAALPFSAAWWTEPQGSAPRVPGPLQGIADAAIRGWDRASEDAPEPAVEPEVKP